MDKWIKQFLQCFGEIAEDHFGARQDLATVEKEVAAVGPMNEVGSCHLRAIEESSAWYYPNWYPSLSAVLKEPVPLPANLQLPSAKAHIVRELQDRLKHIDVVSVLLRFVFPEEFGILSPPTAALLALPYEKDHVAYYLKYLSVLDGFRNNYAGLPRIADVDMALWSAAHAQRNYRALIDEMFGDAYFQQVRLTNLLEGLGGHWRRSASHRMLLANSLHSVDYEVAAAVAGIVCETVVNEIADRVGIDRPIGKHGQVLTGVRVGILSRKAHINGLAVPPKDFERWWALRGSAVHDDPPLSQREPNDFVHEIACLLRAVDEWKTD